MLFALKVTFSHIELLSFILFYSSFTCFILNPKYYFCGTFSSVRKVVFFRLRILLFTDLGVCYVVSASVVWLAVAAEAINYATNLLLICGDCCASCSSEYSTTWEFRTVTRRAARAEEQVLEREPRSRGKCSFVAETFSLMVFFRTIGDLPKLSLLV